MYKPPNAKFPEHKKEKPSKLHKLNSQLQLKDFVSLIEIDGEI